MPNRVKDLLERHPVAIRRTVVVGIALVLALILTRSLWAIDLADAAHTHERATYHERLVEFSNSIAHGDLIPGWAVHFRAGLGSPYFYYYQPGFFYLATPLAFLLPINLALAVTCVLAAMIGFLGIYKLVTDVLPAPCGLLGGVVLICSPYTATNIAIRGDLSEFTATMLVPPALWFAGRFVRGGGLAFGVPAIIFTGLVTCTHPCIALFGIPSIALWCLIQAFSTHGKVLLAIVRTAAVVVFGAASVAFYWLTLLTEQDLVQLNNAIVGDFVFDKHWAPAEYLLSFYSRDRLWIDGNKVHIPLTAGLASLAAVVAAIAVTVRHCATTTMPQLLLMGFGLLVIVGCVFLMDPVSQVVWQTLPLIEKLQFPWRLMSFLSIGMALVASGAMRYRPHWLTWRDALWATAFFGSLMWAYSTYKINPDYPSVQTTEDLLDRDVRPDIADEWLPVDAPATSYSLLRPRGRTDIGVIGDIEATPLIREVNRLSTTITASDGGLVFLQHLWFPTWSATLGGELIELGRGDYGRMIVEIPAGATGDLIVTEGTLPGRFWGTVVSVSSFACLGVWSLVTVFRRRRRTTSAAD